MSKRRHTFTDADREKSLRNRVTLRTQEDKRAYQRAWYHRNKTRLGLVKGLSKPRQRAEPTLYAERREQEFVQGAQTATVDEIKHLRDLW